MNTPTIFDLYNKINALESKVARIEKELEARKYQLTEIQSKNKPTLPDSNLFSQSLLVRSFAVYGHTLLAGLVIAVVMSIITLLISIIFSGFFAAAMLRIFGQ